MPGQAQQLLQSLNGRYPSPAEATELYRRRAVDLQTLDAQSTITVTDLQGLDRIGRFQVAAYHYEKCEPAAKEALANDAHHSVRSTALISSRHASNKPTTLVAA